MILGIFITLLYLLYLIADFKRGVILVGMTIQFLPYVGTGIPKVKVFTLLIVVIFFLYICRGGNSKSGNYPRLLKSASSLFVFSYLISEIFSKTQHHYLTIFSNLITYFLFPYFLWKSIDTKNRLEFALKVLKIFLAISFVFGLMELILSHNYFYEFMSKNLILEDWTEIREDTRYGFKRCQSIYAWYLPYGMISLYGFIVFYAHRFLFYIKKNFQIFMMLAMLFMAFTTGSRAVLLGIIITFVTIVMQKRNFHNIIRPQNIVLLLIVGFLLSGTLYQVYDSIVNSGSSEYARGSSEGMRLNQWLICLPFWLQSPIIGNGKLYMWEVVGSKNSDILGAESIWFSLFVDFGLIGVLSFLFLIWACMSLLRKVDFSLICLPLSYLIMLSLSTFEGATFNILITFSVLILKMNKYFHISFN